ncbi:MAG TPA: DUF378 domain-containing protein [Candidatus Nanoarchaeia archaeon]|nr:DUF378 domain-containing protein [Candidatus Nanoarchaeia archaeon]
MVGNKTVDMISKWLVLIGGLNWGIAGVGGLMKNATLSSGVFAMLGPMIASIVYILVGLSALYMLMGMFKKQ